MAYWLMKTEPEEFSWDDQVKRGKKGEPWSGVRNFTARKNLKDMKKGDKFFFYHTGDEKQVVGIGLRLSDDAGCFGLSLRLDFVGDCDRASPVAKIATRMKRIVARKRIVTSWPAADIVINYNALRAS